jgi:hypothetical protein
LSSPTGRERTEQKRTPKRKKEICWCGWGERQDSIQSANEALIVSKGGPVQLARSGSITTNLFQDTFYTVDFWGWLAGWPPSFFFVLFPSYRVTIVVITIIIIAYCLGWEDFVLLQVCRGNKLVEREREKNELTSAEEQQMARKLLRL